MRFSLAALLVAIVCGQPSPEDSLDSSIELGVPHRDVIFGAAGIRSRVSLSPPSFPPSSPSPSSPSPSAPPLPFSDSVVTVLNMADANSNLKGFVGGFTDGSYAYFAPEHNPSYHGYVARVSLSDFTESGVTYLNLEDTDSNLKGFRGGFTDGSYAYFVPHRNDDSLHGYVARVSLSDFTSSGVTYLNLVATNSNLKGCRGGFTDGSYAYFVSSQQGYVARVSLSDFTDAGVTYINLADTNANLKGFYGGFTDGSYAYFAPNNNGGRHGYVARVSLSDFTNSGVSFLNLADTNADLEGFYGGFTDGSYAYFVPYMNDAGDHGNVARVSLSDFTSSGVSSLNLADTDEHFSRCSGGFSDGRYGYFYGCFGNPYPYDGYVARISVSPHSPGMGWKSAP